MPWKAVAQRGQFVNGRQVVTVAGEKFPVLLLEVGEEVFAIADVCTHDRNPLSDGPLQGDQLVCSRHGARFNIRTGQATLPAPRPVKAYRARLEGEEVLLELP